MSSQGNVVHNMDIIQGIFKDVQATSVNQNLRVYASYLDSFNTIFCSIAYEAASMQVALEDIKCKSVLDKWYVFTVSFPKHATQIYVGMGWALAQEQLNPLEYITEIPPMQRYRVLDGYGYYDGFFRRRKSTVAQEQLSTDDLTALSAYDQGLGRSFWYLTKGNIEGVGRVIESFKDERKNDLWRGIGIAVAYVGGCDVDMLTAIMQLSGTYVNELKTGVAMSVVSRGVAASVNADTEFICKMVCDKTTAEVIAIDTAIKMSLDVKANNVYQEWISKLTVKLA